MLRSGVSGENGSRDDADAMRKHREQWLQKMQHKLPRPPQDRNEADLIARRSPGQGISAGLEIRRTRRPLDIVTSPKSPETSTSLDTEREPFVQSNHQAAKSPIEAEPRNGDLLHKLYDKDRLIKGLQRNVQQLSNALKQAHDRAALMEARTVSKAPSPVAKSHPEKRPASPLEKHDGLANPLPSKPLFPEVKEGKLFAQTKASPRGAEREAHMQARLQEAHVRCKNLSAEVNSLREHAAGLAEKITTLERENTARDEIIKTLEDARCQAEIDWKAAEARVRAELGKAAENELLALRRENVKILNELAAAKGEVVVVRKQAMQAGADKRQSEEAFDHKLRKAHAEIADLSRARARDADRVKDLEVTLTERARENAELEQKLLIKRAAQAAHVVPLEKLEAELASQKRDIKRREDAIAFQRRQQQTEVEVLRQEIQQLCESRDAANKRIEILTQDASKVSLEKLHERLREQERANAELGRRAERDRQLCVEFERKVVELSKHESTAEAGNMKSAARLAFSDVRQRLGDLLTTERALLSRCRWCGSESGLQPHRCQSCAGVACGPCAKRDACSECKVSGVWKLDVDLITATSQTEFRISRLEEILHALGPSMKSSVS